MKLIKKIIGLSLIPVVIFSTTISCSSSSVPSEIIYPKVDVKELSKIIKKDQGNLPSINSDDITAWILKNPSALIIDPNTPSTDMTDKYITSGGIEKKYFESISISKETNASTKQPVLVIDLKLKPTTNKDKISYLFNNFKKEQIIQIEFNKIINS